MFTQRNVVVVLIILLIGVVAGNIYNLSREPDGNGFAANSYGTKAHGYRGIYETLVELGVPVKRSFMPPPFTLSTDENLVIMAPHIDLLSREPEYSRKTMDWVERGGHAILAFDYDGYNLYDDRITSALEAFGISDFRLVEIDLDSTQDTPVAEQREMESRNKREHFGGLKLTSERATGLTTVSLGSSLTGLRKEVKRLRLPRKNLLVIDRTTGTSNLVSELTVRSDDEINYTLVASYRRGDGDLTIVADSSIFVNHLLAKSDNSVLAVNLLAGGERKVMFDEFYHGLNVRGNPFWLLTQAHYGFVLVIILCGLGLWIWRAAVNLGNPLPEKTPSRRSLGEYLDAMATLFLRARHRKFLLSELRSGVFWSLRQKLHLAPGHENIHSLVEALERHDPDKAMRLKNVSEAVDTLVNGRRGISEDTFIKVARELNGCL